MQKQHYKFSRGKLKYDDVSRNTQQLPVSIARDVVDYFVHGKALNDLDNHNTVIMPYLHRVHNNMANGVTENNLHRFLYTNEFSKAVVCNPNKY